MKSKLLADPPADQTAQAEITAPSGKQVEVLAVAGQFTNGDATAQRLVIRLNPRGGAQLELTATIAALSTCRFCVARGVSRLPANGVANDSLQASLPEELWTDAMTVDIESDGAAFQFANLSVCWRERDA